MISAKNVRKSYGSLLVLKGIDLEVRKAEIVAITGKSGAGKSTLLHILGTLDSYDQGSISIKGQAIQDLKGRKLAHFRNREIGFVFQFHHLLPEFTALENVCIPGFLAGRKEQEVRRRAAELLSYLGLAEREKHKPGQLSGGEQQRVAVARALINDPAVVLADEPTGNLDSASSGELHRLLLQLRKDFEQTFIIVTHNAELAAMSDRSLNIVDGQIENHA